MISIRPIQFVDLALKSSKDPDVKTLPDGSVRADWFVLVTAMRLKALVYLLDLYRAQIPFPEQVNVLTREHRNWKSWKIGIEDYAYQWALGQQAWQVGLPVIPVSTPGDKVFKWQMCTPHFQSGRVRIRGVREPSGERVAHPAFRRFIKEALDAPYGDYDDCVDGVCGAVNMCVGPDYVSQEFAGGVSKGFAVVIAGGTGRKHYADPYDVFRSNY